VNVAVPVTVALLVGVGPTKTLEPAGPTDSLPANADALFVYVPAVLGIVAV